MARFDVYANPDPVDRKHVPFLLEVQNHHLHQLHTHVVVPLWLQGSMPGVVQRLNPELKVAGKTVVMDTAALGAVPIGDLRKPVDNLATQQLAIQDALDTLFGSCRAPTDMTAQRHRHAGRSCRFS